MRHAFYVLATVLVAGCADGGVPTPSSQLQVVGAGGTNPSGVGSAGQSGEGRTVGSAGTTPPTTNMSNQPRAGMAGGAGTMAAGGAGVRSMAGAGAAGQPAGGVAAPAPKGSKDPVIPQVTGDCPTFDEGTITFMGLYGIIVQAGAKPPGPTAPMVFYWHGTALSASAYAFDLGPILDGVISEGGVMVAFETSTGGDLTSGTFIFGESDFALTDQLVACAVKNHNVDPRRIYATGCSAGGLFSAAMASMRSSYVAAAAPNSGGWTVPLQFDSENTPALMTVHGAPGVDVVAIDFSVSSETADDGFKTRGGFVINCNTGGGHCGGSYLAGAMWDFFNAHPYGVDPHPWASLPAGFPSECMIY
jgi:hypothetical protein